jgi:predicted permease
MFSQIISIFLNVVTPVFALVALGYTLGTKLQIQYRSLSRTAYYLLIPAFIFNVMSSIKVDLSLAGKMVFAITAIYVGTGALGWLAARLLGYGREMAVAFLMTCVFGNIGNYGLAMTGFRLGEESFGSATIYMVTVNAVAFSVCVLAAGWVRNGGVSALMTVFKTPGIMALPVALIFPVTGSEPPVMVGRITGLLGDAMIPLMLLTLGLQLRETGRLRFGFPVLAASGVRLIGGPLLAFFIIPLVGISGIEAAAGILQGSMPAAVITAIIAMEHDIVPEFVISTVFASTLLSLLTLTVVMALL